MIGQTIAHYHILEKLGEGGMGVVYKARDTHLDRFVALKVLPPEKVADPERKRRFVQEAKAASALNHPSIITIHDIDSDAGHEYIVMEYIPGKTLAQLIGRAGMPLEQALKCAVQMADALSRAHAAGIVHRDLKPSNIMVDQHGLVKILDFGLAKLTERIGPEAETVTAHTMEGAIVGTVDYMSPEQAGGKPVDPRSDIFAFGTVLCEMVSGRRAFQRESGISTLAAILRDEPAPLEEAPADWQRIVSRCLRKSAAERYRSAAELKAALQEVGRPATAPAIAVLPFANLSADKENEYFSDGLAEEIINALTKLPGLRVTARTSAFAFRGKEQDVGEIGAKLRVGHILEGSVRKAGNRIRVTAQLINVADGYHLWSERYDREMTDIFAIQDEICQAIVDKLRVQLAPDRPLVKRHTENLEAYNLYLKGRYYLDKFTREALVKGKTCLEQAIAQDPSYALAHCGMALFYLRCAHHGLVAPNEALPRAKSAALEALRLDEKLAEAHTVLGVLHAIQDFDWMGAEREIRRALELDPASLISRMHCAYSFLRPMRRLEEARAQLRRSVELDPLSLLWHFQLGYVLYLMRQCDQATEQFRNILELDPSYYMAHWMLGMTYFQKGMLDQAIAALERASELSGGNSLVVGMLGYVYACAGQAGEARKLLRELQERARATYVAPLSVAWTYLGLGELDQAFAWLEKGLEERDAMILTLTTDPGWDRLRSEPRYQALLRKMNLEL